MELPWIILPLAGIFIAAGTIKGSLGIGLPTSAIGMMALLIDTQLAVTIVVFPILIANGWQIYRQREFKRILKQYWLYAICIFFSLWLTALMAPNISAKMINLVLGLSIMGFVVIRFLRLLPEIPLGLDKPIQALVGVSSGVLGGIAAVWAPPVALYLLTKRLEREEFVRVSGFLLGTGGLPLTLGYLSNGLMPLPVALTSLAMILPTLIGFRLGEALRSHLNGPTFRKTVLIFFLLMSLSMLWKAMTS